MTLLLILLLLSTVTAVPVSHVIDAPHKVQYLLDHGAIPVDRNGRPRTTAAARPSQRRSLNENQQQQQFEISGAYTLQFYKCASVSTQPYDDDMLFDGNLLPYTTKGQIAAQKSFILFNVCETQYCDFYNAGDENLYMIDVATYMKGATVNYSARKENYCTACSSSQNYCSWVEAQQQKGAAEDWSDYEAAEAEANAAADNAVEEQDQMQQQAEGGGGEDNGARRLRQLVNYKNYEVVECDSCKDLGCWEADDGFDDDAASQWVQNIAACPQTAYDFMNNGLNAFPLYSGFMCNQDGTGVEIALFLDNTCSIYDGVHSYYDLLAKDDTEDSNDMEYLSHAKTMIMFPFLHEIDCNGQLQYLSMQEYKTYAQNYQYEDNNNNQNNNNQNMQVSDYCKNLFDGQKDNGEAISLQDCNADDQNDNRDENNKDQVAEYGDEYENGDVDYMYKYILSYVDSIDPAATCEVVRALNGNYEMIYKWNTSGQQFDYGTHDTSGKNNNNRNNRPIRKWFSQYDKTDITLVAAIVAGVALSIVALACVLYNCFSSGGVLNKKYAMHRRRLDEHRERLVDPATGELA